MILKAKHLYRANFSQIRSIPNAYVLICPKENIDTDTFEGYDSIRAFVCIDVNGEFWDDSNIYFGEKGGFEFSKPSVSDVLQFVYALKENNSNYRYVVKTNSVEKIIFKKYESN